MYRVLIACTLVVPVLLSPSLSAQEPVPELPLPAPEELAPPPEEPFLQAQEPMTGERLGFLIQQIDENAVARQNGYIFRIADRNMMAVFDETADRMRILSPILPTDGLPQELYERMLQANYDSVLDVRYAIANGQIWSVFLHRLSSLTDQDLLSGVAQTAISVDTFGSTFTSGVFTFGGGDSQSLHEDLRRQLEDALEGAEDDRGI